MAPRALFALACFGCLALADGEAQENRKGVDGPQRVPTGGTPKDRLWDALGPSAGKSMVQVNPKDVVAVGETIPPDRATPATNAIVRGCGSKGVGKVVSVQACDLIELLTAAEPPAAAPAEPVKVEPRETSKEASEKTAERDHRTAEELAALRAEVDQVRAERDQVRKKLDEDHDRTTSGFGWVVALVIGSLTLLAIGVVWERRSRLLTSFDRAEKKIDQAANELTEKNARGTRKTDGKI